MRAAVRQNSRKTTLVSPNYEIFTQTLDADRLVLTKLLGLQDRVPVIAQTDFQSFRYPGDQFRNFVFHRRGPFVLLFIQSICENQPAVLETESMVLRCHSMDFFSGLE